MRVSSEVYGNEDFHYLSLDEAIEGIGNLVLEGIKLKDGVERWYRVFITPTDEEKSSDSKFYNSIVANNQLDN